MRARAVLKRALDVTVAGVALVLLAPLLLVLAALIRLDSPGPALFRQTRLGRHGRSFTMYKLRTMRSDADESVHRAYVERLLTAEGSAPSPVSELFKLDGDIRITRVGALLRRSSLDELPQLINVLRGEMSLVGPRPALAYEAQLMPPRHLARFLVRPGITGLWQVSGRNRLTMGQALDLDVVYVETWSLGRDFGIILRTVPAVLRGACR